MKGLLLRCNGLYVELTLDDEKGNSYDILILSDSGGYYRSDYRLFEKDGKSLSGYSGEKLNALSGKRFDLRSYFDSYRRRSFSPILEKDIIRMLSTIKEATNEEFRSYYAFALFCEFLCGFSPKQRSKYFEECFPWFTKFKSYMDSSNLFEMYEKVLSSLDDGEQKIRYAYTICMQNSSGLKFRKDSEMVNWAKRYVSPHILKDETGYEDFLKAYPVFDPETSLEGKVLYEKYQGLGIDSYKLVSYDIKSESFDKLYYHVMHKDDCLRDEDEHKSNDLLLILRLLTIHGYQDKTKELARRFLRFTRLDKNYQFFRAFVSDEEVKEDIMEGLFDTNNDNGFSPLLWFETNDELYKMQAAREKKRKGFFYYDRPQLFFGFAYSISVPYGSIEDYRLREYRKVTRQTDQYKPEKEVYFMGMAGLIRYHDKLILRSLKDEAAKPFEKEPFLCLLKELGLEECSKKDENLHSYLGGK